MEFLSRFQSTIEFTPGKSNVADIRDPRLDEEPAEKLPCVWGPWAYRHVRGCAWHREGGEESPREAGGRHDIGPMRGDVEKEISRCGSEGIWPPTAVADADHHNVESAGDSDLTSGCARSSIVGPLTESMLQGEEGAIETSGSGHVRVVDVAG
eukprot:1147447-Pelagomonas_calceolata.AAC.14